MELLEMKVRGEKPHETLNPSVGNEIPLAWSQDHPKCLVFENEYDNSHASYYRNNANK